MMGSPGLVAPRSGDSNGSWSRSQPGWSSPPIMAPPLLRIITIMAKTDFQKFMQDVFGDSLIRMEQFREDQWSRVENKIAEIGREAVHGEMSAMARRLDEIERRLAALEHERAEKMQEEV